MVIKCQHCGQPTETEEIAFRDKKVVLYTSHCTKCGEEIKPEQKLKPCPFCGGEGRVREGWFGPEIRCRSCGAVVSAKVWDKRVTTDAVAILLGHYAKTDKQVKAAIWRQLFATLDRIERQTQ